jgi:hypothetical protein
MPAIIWVCGLRRCCAPRWGSFDRLRPDDRGYRAHGALLHRIIWHL